MGARPGGTSGQPTPALVTGVPSAAELEPGCCRGSSHAMLADRAIIRRGDGPPHLPEALLAEKRAGGLVPEGTGAVGLNEVHEVLALRGVTSAAVAAQV